MKEQIRAWLNEKIVKGFYRAHSWLLNMAAFLVAVLPDILNYAISNMDTLTGAIPTLSVEHKLHLLMAVNVLSLILKAYKQRNGPIAVAEKETVAATEVFVEGPSADRLLNPSSAIVQEIERQIAQAIVEGRGSLSGVIADRYGVGRLKDEAGPEMERLRRDWRDGDTVHFPVVPGK